MCAPHAVVHFRYPIFPVIAFFYDYMTLPPMDGFVSSYLLLFSFALTPLLLCLKSYLPHSQSKAV